MRTAAGTAPAAGSKHGTRRAERQRSDYRELAAVTPHRQSVAPARAPPAPARFPPAAKIVCRSAPAPAKAGVIENTAPEAEAPPPLAMDDIERAYGDDVSAIMREYANRMAGARSGGEKRSIKTARKSALAAAKDKATRAKAARKAANAAMRQSVVRRPPARPEPRPG
jgi:hypothetical protein